MGEKFNLDRSEIPRQIITNKIRILNQKTFNDSFILINLNKRIGNEGIKKQSPKSTGHVESTTLFNTTKSKNLEFYLSHFPYSFLSGKKNIFFLTNFTITNLISISEKIETFSNLESLSTLKERNPSSNYKPSVHEEFSITPRISPPPKAAALETQLLKNNAKNSKTMKWNYSFFSVFLDCVESSFLKTRKKNGFKVIKTKEEKDKKFFKFRSSRKLLFQTILKLQNNHWIRNKNFFLAYLDIKKFIKPPFKKNYGSLFNYLSFCQNFLTVVSNSQANSTRREKTQGLQETSYYKEIVNLNVDLASYPASDYDRSIEKSEKTHELTWFLYLYELDKKKDTSALWKNLNQNVFNVAEAKISQVVYKSQTKWAPLGRK